MGLDLNPNSNTHKSTHKHTQAYCTDTTRHLVTLLDLYKIQNQVPFLNC